MLRCVASNAVLAIALAAASTAAVAQMSRLFPATALRGELIVTQAPEVQLNGKAARLAAGARIRGADNLFKVSGAIVGQRLLVHYTFDFAGELQDVWVLTPAEASRQPWPTTLQQAASWSFNPDAQLWSRP
jgi:hypothetical protein